MYRDKYFALFLFGVGALALITIGYIGREYYFLSLPEKYQSALHPEMGPSSLWGHGLGIIGSVLMSLHSSMNSCMPTSLVSMPVQAGLVRVGRRSRSPRPSRQS